MVEHEFGHVLDVLMGGGGWGLDPRRAEDGMGMNGARAGVWLAVRLFPPDAVGRSAPTRVRGRDFKRDPGGILRRAIVSQGA